MRLFSFSRQNSHQIFSFRATFNSDYDVADYSFNYLRNYLSSGMCGNAGVYRKIHSVSIDAFELSWQTRSGNSARAFFVACLLRHFCKGRAHFTANIRYFLV